METITLAGRNFTISVVDTDDDGQAVYELTGVRGARYRTMRNRHRPAMMFLVGSQGKAGFTVDPLGRLWLTDAGGSLGAAA